MSTIQATVYEEAQLLKWVAERKPALLGFMQERTPTRVAGVERRPVMRLTSTGDAWMLVHCPFVWVREQIMTQYGEGRPNRDGKTPWWRTGLKRKIPTW